MVHYYFYILRVRKGGRFNYIYGGDINNDGSSTNDLIYVPTTTEIATMAFSGGPLKVRHLTGLSVKISI
jgi:hypothetical protein